MKFLPKRAVVVTALVLAAKLLVITLVLTVTPETEAQSQDTNSAFSVTPVDVIASVHSDWLRFNLSDRVVRNFAEDRQRLIRDLLKTFNNPNTPNFNRCT